MRRSNEDLAWLNNKRGRVIDFYGKFSFVLLFAYYYMYEFIQNFCCFLLQGVQE